jgi:hypothetical protein
MDNDSATHSTRVRWSLLQAARDYEGENLLLFTDADEILSANLLEGDLLDRLTSLRPGTAVRLELVNLWRSPLRWRCDGSPWADRWMDIGWRDDRRASYREPTETLDHNPRIPDCRQRQTFQDLKLLHLQFVVFSRMLSKQRRYRALEAVELGPQKAEEVNLRYCRTRDEGGLRLAPVDPTWTEGWARRGVDLTCFEERDLYWFDVDVLRCFARHGAAYFAPVDLWDTDWEAKRCLAAQRGFAGVPASPIRDPRSLEQRCYHAYLHGHFRTPPWRDPAELWRAPARWARAGFRATGLRRRHLERLGLRPRNDTARETAQGA